MRDRSSLVLLVALVLVLGAAVGLAGFRFGAADESISIELEPVSTAAPVPTAAKLPTAPAMPATPPTHELVLVGALRLDPFDRELHADVAAYKNLAFVGSRCMSGVQIVDISNPTAPVRLASTASYPNTAMEDIKAIRIGGRDVLAIGLQDCASNPGLGPGKLGLELVDISEPARPRTLSTYAIGAGVHEFDLTETPSGRVLALLAAPGYEAGPTAGAQGIVGLQIVDVSDPERPALLATWSVLGEPSLGRAF